MPPQRIRPTKQERLQRRQNPLRRPSPVLSAPPVEGDGTDDTTNVNDDENAMLRAELANVREQLADVRQLAKLATWVIEEQDRTIAELKAALEDEKTRRRALQSQLQNCRFNLQFHQWWNKDHALTPWTAHHHSRWERCSDRLGECFLGEFWGIDKRRYRP
ncbi:hypothetical protein FN846DRAFT_920473 [Sphaerosporella brunnea]|uniref:Uncharacterized protein n=1 Tax=Sphaerosporella brunnea TaxID=1250544 RepID=A0A5J5ESW3_9PEZI|nr:hypothetical protein FN846DRAFT_920473 [Sphaerosporella brunnea]